MNDLYADLGFRVIEFGKTVQGGTTQRYRRTISDHPFSLAGARAALLEIAAGRARQPRPREGVGGPAGARLHGRNGDRQ